MSSHASMNRIHRLVGNAALKLRVAVAENAGNGARGGSGRRRVVPGPVAAAGFSLTAAGAAVFLMLATLPGSRAHAANAADAVVSSGAGSVATSGTTTTITQASQRLAIDWSQLSTAAAETLVFAQPNAQAIALNRITGSSPSELLGSLTANGQVFILNPNGVLFGAGSQVNVGGLVASTLTMSNADFESGSFNFSGSGGGAVVNQGTLRAAPGGYLALLAPEVRNEGVMTASLGTALLAAGNKLTLNLDNGSLLGYSIDQGAIQALAENRQLIQADGGQVLLSAQALDALTTATVNNTGVIEARTLQNRAGRILLMGDMQHGTVKVGGTLDASAPGGGDGGFIETSAAHVKVADDARITTRAAGGQTGRWLIDPNDFTIDTTGGDMSAAAVAGALASTNFEVATATMGTAGGNGDITVFGDLAWSSANTLTLTAQRNINIYKPVTATNGGLTINAAGTITAPAGVNVGTFTLSNGSWRQTGALSAFHATDFRINGGTFVRTHGGDGNSSASAYLLTDIYGLQGMRSSGMLGKHYKLVNDIDASGTTAWNGGAGFVPVGVETPATGHFTGSLDGQGHRITGLFINRPTSTTQVGLFGYAGSGSSLSNMVLDGGSITGNNHVGALAGESEASITNVFSSATVRAAGVGAGGLVDKNWGAIVRSGASGHVSTGRDSAGGLVGANYGSISESYASGRVQGGTNYAGGLAGSNSFGATITDSYASGDVSGIDSVGGLVGFQSGQLTRTYASGAATGSSSVGGLVGWNNRPANAGITASFYNSSFHARGIGAGPGNTSAAGRTTAALRQAATFAGWSISAEGGSDAVWRIYEGQSGPLLRSLLKPLALADTTTSYNGSVQSGATPAAAGVLGAAASGRDAGTYSAAHYSGQQGYDLSGGRLTITRAGLTVSAHNDSRTEGAGPYSGGQGVSYSGFVGGDTAAVLGGTLGYGGSSQGASVAGSYAITPGGYSAGNYTLTYLDGVLTIYPAPARPAASPAPFTAVAALAGDLYASAVQTVAGLRPDTGRRGGPAGAAGADAAALASAAAEAGNTGEDE